MAKEYTNLTKRTAELLARPEGRDVEFKVKLEGLKASHLVAFANSSEGGTIFIGVSENTIDGVQRGKVVGCNVDDDARLTIVNKAAGCTPPIYLEIHVENLGDTPFFRLEIPTGQNKPYCSFGGKYQIRDDGSTRALHPDELLAMFMAREGEQFLDRFKHAVSELEQKLEAVDSNMQTEVNKLTEKLSAATNQARDVGVSLWSIEEKLEALLREQTHTQVDEDWFN